MIRIVKMTGKFYGVELPDDFEKAMEEIKDFVSQGVPVIVVENLSELEDLDIYDEAIMVNRDDS